MLAPPREPLRKVMALAARLRAAGDRRAPSRAVLRMMWFAALQKAQGARWDVIGQVLGRRARTCERWTWKYATYWRSLYLAAEDYALEVSQAEAAIVLARAGYDLNDPKLRRRK